MALATRLAVPVVRRVPRCTIAVLADSMPDEDLAVFGKALADPTMLATDLARALRAEGYDVGESTIRRHRRGDCRCHVVG